MGLSLFALFHFLVYLLSSLKQASKRASCWVLSFKEGNLIFPLLASCGSFLGFSSSVLFCAVLGIVFWVRVLCFKPASIQRVRIGCGGVGALYF